jgi:putative membrane protein
MMADHLIQGIVQSLIFTVLGVVVFAAAFLVIVKALPFSVRKEIEVDQNTALGIMLGAVIIGLSIIIAAAIH